MHYDNFSVTKQIQLLHRKTEGDIWTYGVISPIWVQREGFLRYFEDTAYLALEMRSSEDKGADKSKIIKIKNTKLLIYAFYPSLFWEAS